MPNLMFKQTTSLQTRTLCTLYITRDSLAITYVLPPPNVLAEIFNQQKLYRTKTMPIFYTLRFKPSERGSVQAVNP